MMKLPCLILIKKIKKKNKENFCEQLATIFFKTSYLNHTQFTVMIKICLALTFVS